MALLFIVLPRQLLLSNACPLSTFDMSTCSIPEVCGVLVWFFGSMFVEALLVATRGIYTTCRFVQSGGLLMPRDNVV